MSRTNPFYSPENFDPSLVLEATADFTRYDYSFDYRAVWRVEGTRDFYTAYDSGCSCPTPFEDYTSLSDLTPVKLSAGEGRESWASLRREALANMQPSDQDRFYGDFQPDALQIKDYILILDRLEAEVRAQS